MVALIPDDERRGHQPLLLQALMGVHPERAAEAQREIIIGATAWGNRGSGNARHAVLSPGRGEPVPMDEAWFVDAVFDPHAKSLADVGGEAERAAAVGSRTPRLSCRSPRCRAAPASGRSAPRRRRPATLPERSAPLRAIADPARVATPPAMTARRDNMGSLLERGGPVLMRASPGTGAMRTLTHPSPSARRTAAAEHYPMSIRIGTWRKWRKGRIRFCIGKAGRSGGGAH